MTPLMATTVALVMGWPRRASMSLTVAASGVALTIALGFVVGATLPFDLLPTSNAQISSRISPTLADLAIAIAAGAAGAVGLSRPDVSDALPGVAIAISLVPPLAVTGLLISDGDYSDALGAFLLFSTNMVAILLAGAVTFVLTGVAPIGQIAANRRRVQSSLTLVATLAILIVAVLALTSEHLQAEAFSRTEVTSATEAWLDNTDLALVETTITGSSVALVVAGAQQPPPVEELGRTLDGILGDAVEVTVTWVPSQEFVYEGSGSG
jgi:uncharacterized hydrophobic protein (TIGR00271 family)